MLNLSRVVWDYSSNSLVVVMTHQRLNIGVYFNMQRKPIANKYRKGTMKSTLHSTLSLRINHCFGTFATRYVTSSNGSERESEIALQANIHILRYTHTQTHVYFILLRNLNFIQRSTIGQSVFAPFLMVAGYYVILIYIVCFAIIFLRTQLSDPSWNTDQGVQLDCES